LVIDDPKDITRMEWLSETRQIRSAPYEFTRKTDWSDFKANSLIAVCGGGRLDGELIESVIGGLPEGTTLILGDQSPACAKAGEIARNRGLPLVSLSYTGRLTIDHREM